MLAKGRLMLNTIYGHNELYYAYLTNIFFSQTPYDANLIRMSLTFLGITFLREI